MNLFEEEFAKYQDAVRVISNFLKSQGINFTVIGGVAVGLHGFHRQTDDLDILVDKKDEAKMNSLPVGFIRRVTKKRFNFHDPDVSIDVLYSGEKAGSEKSIKFVLPNTISEEIKGVSVISLKFLIVYKIASGLYGYARLHDFGDVQRLIQLHKLPENFIDGQRQDLVKKYKEIWRIT